MTANFPIVGRDLTFVMSGAGAATTAQSGSLMLGLSSISLPIFGGILLVNPITAPAVTLPPAVTLSPAVTLPPGGAPAGFTLPMTADPALDGMQLIAQRLQLDPGAPQGVAMSRGLQLILGRGD